MAGGPPPPTSISPPQQPRNAQADQQKHQQQPSLPQSPTNVIHPATKAPVITPFPAIVPLSNVAFLSSLRPPQSKKVTFSLPPKEPISNNNESTSKQKPHDDRSETVTTTTTASQEKPAHQQSSDEEENYEEAEEENFPKRRRPTAASDSSFNRFASSIMCQRCRWRKNNSACDLKMCLTCCVDSNRSHVSARATKQKMLSLEQQATTQPRIAPHRPQQHQQPKHLPLAPLFVNPCSPAPARFPTPVAPQTPTVETRTTQQQQDPLHQEQNHVYALL